MDAVTRDGDLINRKGGFEGGYRDERVSKIYNVSQIREYTTTQNTLRIAQAELENEDKAVEVRTNNILRELQRIETERNHLRETINSASAELSQRLRQYETGMENLAKRQNIIASMEHELRSYENQIIEYQSEMSSDMHRDMNESERLEVQSKSEEARNIQVEPIDDVLINLRRTLRD